MANLWSTAEVYGLRADTDKPEIIDPHSIFETTFIGYDTLRRNIMMTVLNHEAKAPFCRMLRRKFPEYQSFVVSHTGHNKITPQLSKRVYYPQSYQC